MIAVIGDLLLDVFLLSTLREDGQAEGVVVRGGGSAANTAAWLAWYGRSSLFVGCCGDDVVGNLLIDELKAYGIQTMVRQVDGCDTGAVVVEVTDTGERVMRSARGANRDLSPNDLVKINVPKMDCVHLTGYSLLGPSGLDILVAAGELARRYRAWLAFDPSSVGVIRRFGRQTLLDAIWRAGVGTLLPNAEEAQELAACDVVDSPVMLAEYATSVVVKMGGEGALCYSDGKVRKVPAAPRPARDTTGAGDAFDAGILMGILDHRPLPEACKQGHELGGKVIGQFGGRPPYKRLRARAINSP